MATSEVVETKGLLDVRPYMPAIRRRARLMVTLQQLDELRRGVEGKNLERVDLIESLVRDGLV